ncbi:MAG: RNA-directed DNA polymerase [Treponema sp.]|jgi:retron-type reverse transcriptase|nr:RNA-directed DNA polymerase [Treponema sp.]
MMQGELFPAISIDDIFAAYHECRKHKRGRTGALQFEVDLEKNLVELWQELLRGDWSPGPSTVFIVTKPVTREIFAASFRDRIVHHLIISRLNHLFEKTFIRDSYSCRVGKGTHFGIARVHRFGRRCSQNGIIRAWVLKLDICGYFMNINRDILFAKLSLFIDRRYHAPDKEPIKELCRLIIFNDPTANCIRHSPQEAWHGLPAGKSLFTTAKNCGLPIGNLTSQIFANFYLNEFDHFIKSRCGVRFYGRYVDDCVIVHHSKDFLVALIAKLRHFLMSELGLTLHPKKIYLQPCGHGVKFLGCFIKPSHIVVHHRTIANFTRSLSMYNALALDHKPDKKELTSFISSVNSYLGIMKHYKTYKKRRAVLLNNIAPHWHKLVSLSEGYCKIEKGVKKQTGG